ncbi:hydrophobin family protein [Aspergillus lucknowensis]|uniref:Hydrophobin n=1 Tax=Aspergillus lucknowensis TaxID=176173 RepID=A0ABR4M1X0_9EURO
MKFTFGVAALSLFAATSAFPNRETQQEKRFPIPDGMTVGEGSSKCGDQAQLSCCNDVRYGGDSTVVADGIAAGLLSNLLGAGSAAEGLGAFSQCSKLNVDLLIGLSDILNQQCKQNIACCANSPGSADGDLVGAALPCIALGSIL